MIAAALFLAASIAPADAIYLKHAVQDQLARYALATLAEKKATTAQLRSFARGIVPKAAARSRSLATMAKGHGIPAPTEPGTRDIYHYAQLLQKNGSGFDTRFVTDLTIDDTIVMQSDRYEMSHGSDAALRAFAKKRYDALAKEKATLSSIRMS